MSSWSSWRVPFISLLLGAMGCGSTLAQPSKFDADLLFHSLRHGASQIYLANSNSGETRRLREGSDEDIDASWSPDGQRLLFVSRHLTNSDIFVADADGGNLQRLTDHPGFDGGARWSPDGSMIAFISGRAGGAKLYLMNADGSKQRRLTDLVEGDETSHSWSPDGQSIVFTVMIKRQTTVWTARADGSQVARLTTGDRTETSPAWSPSGRELAYVSTKRANVALRVLDLASMTERELAQPLTGKTDLVWTADGKHLVFEGRADNNPRSDIYMVSAAGGEAVNLSKHPAEEMNARVSPAGDRVSFVSYRAGAFGQVFVLDLQSGALKQITDSGKHEFRPVWRPSLGKQGAARLAGAAGEVG